MHRNLFKHKYKVGLSIVILALLLPVFLVSLEENTDNRQLASEIRQQPPPADYKKDEILIRFKNDTPQIATQGKALSHNKSSGEVAIDDVDENSLPGGLRQLKNKGKVKAISKGIKHPDIVFEKDSQAADVNPAGDQLYKVTLNGGETVEDAIRSIQSDPNVEEVVPNYVFSASAVPNDPYYLDSYPTQVTNRDASFNPPYDYQWNLKKISYGQAYDQTANLAKVTVAVIDSGIDYTHSEFGSCTLSQVRGNTCPLVLPGVNYNENDDDPMDDWGHGSHVTGIIAAGTNNSQGIAGVARNVRILPIKIFDSTGSTTFDIVLSALDYAAFSGARIVNASFEGSGTSDLLEQEVDQLYNNNILFVAAAGNTSSDASLTYPGGITCATPQEPNKDCTLTVSATNVSDYRANYSNWGSMIDVAAPGGENSDIISVKSSVTAQAATDVGGKYRRASGTSSSAPHVTGLAALILGKQPGLTIQQVRNYIIKGVDDIGVQGKDIDFGYGRINIKKTLDLMNTAPTMTPTRTPTPSPTRTPTKSPTATPTKTPTATIRPSATPTPKPSTFAVSYSSTSGLTGGTTLGMKNTLIQVKTPIKLTQVAVYNAGSGQSFELRKSSSSGEATGTVVISGTLGTSKSSQGYYYKTLSSIALSSGYYVFRFNNSNAMTFYQGNTATTTTDINFLKRSGGTNPATTTGAIFIKIGYVK